MRRTGDGRRKSGKDGRRKADAVLLTSILGEEEKSRGGGGRSYGRVLEVSDSL